MKRMNNYYIKQLTEDQLVILGNVQRLTELRDYLTYDDLSRSDISELLFELHCNFCAVGLCTTDISFFCFF